MPKGGKYDRCISKVKRRGRANAYAVCSKLRTKTRSKKK